MQRQTLISRSVFLLTVAAGISAMAQSDAALDDQIGDLVRAVGRHDPIVFPQEELIAGLPYDGVSPFAHMAQDFESEFDQYDVFLIEDIEPNRDANLREFRSAGFGNGNPLGAEDFVVRVFQDNGTGLPGEDGYTGMLVMRSVPGVWFIDISTNEFVTDFGGQRLEAGAYYLVWHVRLDFGCCGHTFFFQQQGEPIAGGGDANNAWQWVPLDGFGVGTHIPVRDDGRGERRGVNYLLFGTPICASPDCPADFDFDGDLDADDFFTFLDVFTSDDPCADLTGNGTIDVNDFFAYLDLFVQGCD